jgi:hypothetical protein
MSGHGGRLPPPQPGHCGAAGTRASLAGAQRGRGLPSAQAAAERMGQAPARTGHGRLEAQGAEAGADLAADAHEVKGEGVRAGGGGAQLAVPVNKARGGGVSQHQLVGHARVHLPKHGKGREG